MAEFNFTNGKFKEAIDLYEKEIPKIKYNGNNYINLAECYRNLNDYKSCVNTLQKAYDISKDNIILLKIGIVFNEQKKITEADDYFKKVVKSQDIGYLNNNTIEIINILSKNQKFDYAIEIIDNFEKKSKKNKDLAIIKGEIFAQMGDLQKMIDYYISLVEESQNEYDYIVKVKIYRIIFYNEINKEIVINLLKKDILKNPDKNASMNILSWIFLQNNMFSEALPFAKSLYLRKYWVLGDFFDFGKRAYENKNYNVTKQVFSIIEQREKNNNHFEFEIKRLLIKSEYFTLEDNISSEDLIIINNKYNEIITKYGITNQTSEIIIDYSYFLSYNLNKSEKSLFYLEEILKNNRINTEIKAKTLIAKGDVFSYINDFTNALLEYARAEKLGKRTQIEDEAKFKSAKISFYMGDFKWAKHQLNIFKKNTTRLNSNDAIYLSLLIYENLPTFIEDSLKTEEELLQPLKLYAKAEFLKEHKDLKKCLILVDSIFTKYPKNSIIDEVLLLKASIYEELKDFEKAEKIYLEIESKYPYEFSCQISEFYLAKMYLKNKDIEKAKLQLEKIIFNRSGTTFFTESRDLYNNIK